MSLRIRRGTDAQRTGVTFLEGELIYTTDTKKLYVGDGTTAGGVAIDSTTGSINQLADVNIAGIQVGQILEWNGTQFVPGEDQGDKESITGADSTILVDATNSSINLDGTVKGHIIPDQNEVYNLGSSSNRFNDLFLSGNTINLGGATITATGGEINMALKSSGNVDTNDNTITNTAAGGHVVVAPTAGKEFKVDDTVGGTSFSVNTTLKSVDIKNGYGLKLATFGSAQYTAINGSEQAGQIVFDNPSKTLKLYNGTGWVSVGGVGGGNGVIEGQTYDININGDIVGDDSTVLLDTASKNLNVISGAFSGVVTAGTLNANTINGDLYGSVVGDAHIQGSITARDSSVFFDSETRDINVRNISADIITANQDIVGNFKGTMAGDDSTILVDGPGNRIAAEAIEGSIDIASGNIRFEYEGADQVNFRTTGISVEGAAGPRLLYRSQRGTLAAPQPVQGGTSGDTMLDARGEGYVGPTNLYKTAGIIRISTDLDATVSDAGSGANPGRVTFLTANSSGTVANICTMDSDNQFGIATSRPEAQLHVKKQGSHPGNAKIDGHIQAGVQTISGPGAIDLDTTITEITTTGADAFTLANGATGQIKIIVMTVDGGDATITPTTFANGTSITMDDANDSITMVYGANGWVVIALQGATINA
jgi:hypothetical protein